MSGLGSKDQLSALVSSDNERAFTFWCEGCQLVAILHSGRPGAREGVLVVVGGPQYRVGSHRQFVRLARTLSMHGYPVLRFDYRGMGDSEGEQRSFQHVDSDIRAALDVFQQSNPALETVNIFGLCDAASAALLYGPLDERVRGLLLVNPWVRTSYSEARTYLRHYYPSRLLAWSLWKKLFAGNFDARAAWQSLRNNLQQVAGGHGAASNGSANILATRMAQSLGRYSGRVLLALSGADLTAAEFESEVDNSEEWRKLLSADRVEVLRISNADHTLSRREWSDALCEGIVDWLRRSEPMPPTYSARVD